MFGRNASSKDPLKPTIKNASGAFARFSSGFEQFCSVLQVQDSNYAVLDLSELNQANVVFLAGFGHRVSSDDIMNAMQQSFGSNFRESQQSASNAQRFLDQALIFPDESFDGILAWDTLQFLTQPLLDRVIAQLLRIMRPKGVMLTFFSASEKATELPIYSYRIADRKSLSLTPRAAAQRIQYYNNRFIEKAFENASSLKFFLTRDHLREVLVRK